MEANAGDVLCVIQILQELFWFQEDIAGDSSHSVQTLESGNLYIAESVLCFEQKLGSFNSSKHRPIGS